MRRFVLFVLGLLLFTMPLLAGNAHFVGAVSVVESGNTVTASGKVAGLGDVPQLLVTLSGDAECVNRGGNKPSAANKDSFATSGSFPVQNGKALFSLTLTATFQPSCQPPMSVDWSNVHGTVTADDGTFLVF